MEHGQRGLELNDTTHAGIDVKTTRHLQFVYSNKTSSKSMVGIRRSSRSLNGAGSLSSSGRLDIVQSPVLDESLRGGLVDISLEGWFDTYQEVPEQDNDRHLSNRRDENRCAFFDFRAEVL